METPAHAPRKDAVLHTLSKAWDSGTESASGIMQGAKHHLLEEPMRDAIRQAVAATVAVAGVAVVATRAARAAERMLLSIGQGFAGVVAQAAGRSPAALAAPRRRDQGAAEGGRVGDDEQERAGHAEPATPPGRPRTPERREPLRAEAKAEAAAEIGNWRVGWSSSGSE